MSNSVQPHRQQLTRLPKPGILQARTLEWVAISFSNPWKWKVKVMLLSDVWLLGTPWTAACQAPPSMGFSRQGYWSGVPLPSPVGRYTWSNKRDEIPGNLRIITWRFWWPRVTSFLYHYSLIYLTLTLGIQYEISRSDICKINSKCLIL